MKELEYISQYKNKFYITVFLVFSAALLLSVSVGFSALNQNLSVSGDVDYEKNDKTLYGVLRKAAAGGIYAKEMIGSHQDSFSGTGTQSVYYWKASNDTNANIILDKWNVIFAGFCWQMIRTTDTGGVKMIYNGVPNSGKCNNTGTAQQIGTSSFNVGDTPASVGYMNNKKYYMDWQYFSSWTLTNDVAFSSSYSYSNGTYTLTNPIIITTSNYSSNYGTLKGYYFCGYVAATSCTELKYVTYANSSNFYYKFVDHNTIYANSFTYNSSTDTYTLGSDRIRFWNILDNTNLTNMTTHHYTCFNDTGSCSSLSYIYLYKNAPPTFYYLTLKTGVSIETALNEMLYNNDVNTNDSKIKSIVDSWYRDNMTSYTSKLEDTIFCNERSQSNASTNGWNKNGGSLLTTMYFSHNIKCPNTTDQFSVANSTAKLNYPVGLFTYSEMNLLSNDILRKTGNDYWLMTPRGIILDDPVVLFITSSGATYTSLQNPNVSLVKGVRPAVSIKPNTEYSSGTGSKDDPYIVQ